MHRTLLLAAAALFFLWEHVALALWLRAHGGLAAGLTHAWATLRQDWLVLLVLTDACVFSACALVWLWRDLGRHVAARSARARWIAAALIWGSPTLLVYLARRHVRAEAAPRPPAPVPHAAGAPSPVDHHSAA